MKKNALIIGTIIFFSLLFTLPALSAQQWVPFIPGTDSAEPFDISIVSSSVDEVIVNFSFPGMFTDLADGGIYTQISIPDCGYTTAIGKPQLPMLGRFIAIPDEANVSVEILTENQIELEGYTIYPAQEPLADTDSIDPPAFAADPIFYGINPPNRFYPSRNYSLGGLHIIRGCNVRILRIFPIQYNPYSRIIRAFSNIRVRFIFSNGNRTFINKRLRNTSFDQLFKKILLNDPTITLPFPVRSKRTAYEEGNSFLIITHPDFSTAAESLKHWKIKKGISTEIWTTNGTESANDIRLNIKDKYDNDDTPPTYVLLIGDSDKIPVHYKTPHPSTGQLIATDLYYSTVDGDDYFPDINIGRLSVATQKQAEKRISDIINYEKNPVEDESFYKKAAICAYFQDDSKDGKADRRFAQTSEDMALFLESSGYVVDRLYTTEAGVTPLQWATTWWTFGGGLAGTPGGNIPEYLKKPGFKWDANRVQISNAINEGRFLVTHRDHGAQSGWGDPAYTINDVNALTNGNRLPIVLSINCETGWFDNGSSFSEAWERNPNGGAIGVIAATRISYSGHNDRLAWGWMDAIWPEFNQSYQPDETPFDHPMWEMGPVFNYGKYYYAANFGEDEFRKAEFEMFHWFGDPTMQIWTKEPKVLNVSHASTIAANTSFISVTVENSDSLTGTIICISQDGSILAKKLSQGQQTEMIALPEQLVTDKPIDITVSRHNYKVYENSIVISAASALARGIVEFIDSSKNAVNIYQAGTVNEATVRVIDSDRNADPKAIETLTIQLTSDTDNNSIPAAFTNPITGVHNKGNAQIEEIKVSENTKTEDWYIKRENGLIQITGSISGLQREYSNTGYQYPPFQSYNKEIEFTITGTMSEGDSFTLTTKASDVVGENLVLIETDIDSGIFEAAIPLNESSPITNNAVLEIAAGDWITAYYTDPTDEFGNSVRINSKAIYAQGTIIPGITYNEDTTWTKAESPYLISGDVVVGFGATLTIEAGVIVNFMPETDDLSHGDEKNKSELYLYGHLIANGTDSENITFTTSSKKPSLWDWGGIRFNGNGSSGNMSYAVVEYSSYGIHLYYNSSLNIENSIIRNNGKGITSNVGSDQYEVNISNCTIEKNRSEGICIFSNRKTFSIQNNNISENERSGIFLNSNYDAITISYNTISKNRFYGIENEFDKGKILLANNTLLENGTSGIHVKYRGVEDITIINNSVSSSNNYGINLVYQNISHEKDNIKIKIEENTISNCSNSGIRIINHTEKIQTYVTNNSISACNSSGLYIDSSIHNLAIIENNIITGCNSAAVSLYNYVVPHFKNNIIDNNKRGIYYSSSVDSDIDPPIIGNTITNNKEYGICILNFASPIINNNNIYNNGPYSIHTTTSFDIDARQNWWGDEVTTEIETGNNPKNLSAIYDYYDDETIGTVNYANWLTAPILKQSPEISLSINSTNLASGNAYTIPFDIIVGESVDITCVVKNIGGSDLIFGHATQPSSVFAITQQADSPLSPNCSDAFVIHFEPSSAGMYSTTVQFSNNDPDENPFYFHVYGKAQEQVTTQPVLSVSPQLIHICHLASTSSIAVSNEGTGNMPWTASVDNDNAWISIDSGTSGNNTGIISISCDANTSNITRTGTITINAQDAMPSFVTVYIVQAPSGLVNNKVILTLNDTQGFPGDTNIPLMITLDNLSINTPVASMQLSLKYDATIGIHASSDYILLTRTKDFNVSVTINENGANSTILVLLYSMSGKLISPDNAPILKLLFNIDENARPKTSSIIEITECLVSDESASQIASEFNDKAVFLIKEACEPGDINCDKALNIFDLQILINVITEKETDPERIKRSDINTDGAVNIFDLQKLINCIISDDCQMQSRQLTTFKSKLRSKNTYNMENICILPSISTANNYTGTFGLNLENVDNVASGQIRFTYDSTIGLNITGVNFASRAKGYNPVSFTKKDSDPENVEILVLFYSTGGATIPTGSGSILEFDYKTTEKASGETVLSFKECLLANSNGNALSTSSQNGKLIIGQLAEGITYDISHVIMILQFLSGIEINEVLTELDTNNNNSIGLEDLIYILLKLSDQNSQIIETFHSEKNRVLSPDIQPIDLETLITGNTSFALKLYQKIATNNQNTFLSPYSITLALAMTYAGARNQTAQQMADTLHFTLSQEHLHPAFNYLDQEMASRGKGADSQDGKGFRLNIANSLWGRKGAYFLPEFMDILALNYGAGMRLLDFINAPESSRLVINNWVSDQTENTINDLLPEGSITPATRLVLTNAIYFNAAWADPFEESLTSPALFNLLDSSQEMVPMMTHEAHYGYVDAEGYQAVEIPYDGMELSMLVIVPDMGLFESFESNLNTEQLYSIINNLEWKDLRLRFPKFKFESGSIRLKKVLSEMGMTDAFSSAADFSGIAGTNNLAISDVIHKAFISVDESGTEASAATAVIFIETAIPDYLDVFIDRPFIFLIRDIETSAVLFMGKVVNPVK